MSFSPHVLFAGGGAVGHLVPGLAVAEHLRRRMPGVQISFAGCGAARERHAVRAAGHHYTMIPAQAAPRNPVEAVRFVTDNVAGYCAARWMLREQRVSLVVGLGGTTSITVGRAALARGIPIVLLEPNAVPGRATRWLSHVATMVCAGFEDIRAHLVAQAPLTVTGNPARVAFEDLYAKLDGRAAATVRAGLPANLPPNLPTTALPHPAASRRPPRLVILGGAAAARPLNDAMPAVLKKLGDKLANWQIVHQTGEGQLQETESRYAQLGVRALTVNHIDEMAPVLFDTDLVVSRAAANTLAELALTATPAVLVPYSQAADQHQAANAKAFAAAGACRVVAEVQTGHGLDGALARELDALVSDHHLRTEMARNMLRLARPHAGAQIAGAIADHLCGVSRVAA